LVKNQTKLFSLLAIVMATTGLGAQSDELAGVGRISISVRDASGVPIPAAWIIASEPPLELLIGGSGTSAFNLKFGSYNLTAYARGFRPQTKRIDVVRQGKSGVDFILNSGDSVFPPSVPDDWVKRRIVMVDPSDQPCTMACYTFVGPPTTNPEVTALVPEDQPTPQPSSRRKKQAAEKPRQLQ
jgi:hypothetical protein